MSNRIIISIFCVISIITAMAQEEASDSAAVSVLNVAAVDGVIHDNAVPLTQFSANDSALYGNYHNVCIYRPDNFIPYRTFAFPQYITDNLMQPIPAFHYTYVSPGVIYNNDNLQISGNVDIAAYPGMMNKATGTLGVSVQNEKLSFYVGGIVNKYSFYSGLIRQPGIHGSFTYRFSSPLSFTAYAYYYGRNAMPMMPDGSPMPPSMLGYYDVSRFGGYLNYRATEKLGILMGGQMVERHGPRNYYEVEPIATPYINVGRGKKKIGIGLPVGQIIYGLFGR